MVKSNKPDSQIIIYQTELGQTKIEVRLQDETVWLTQKLMAELFQKDVRTINEHIKNILDEGELETESTIRKFLIVQREGERDVERLVDFPGSQTPVWEPTCVKNSVLAMMNQ